jgi:MFS family permease
MRVKEGNEMRRPIVTETQHKKILGLHPNVFFLGLVSFFTDVSSEMIFTLVPLFMTNVLGVSTTLVGLVGGISDSTDALFRLISGRISDKVGKRKFFTTLGYGLATAVKPLMLLADGWAAVTGIRFGDRIGKGLRSSSRDALLADSLGPDERGRGFGLHRAMDTAGAMVGLAIVALIIYLFEGTSSFDMQRDAYRMMVTVGIFPAIAAVLILIGLVRERKSEVAKATTTAAMTLTKAAFDLRFKLYLAVMAVFTMGNSSDFFLILRAQNIHAPLIQVAIMLVLFNAVYAAVATPMGVLSDKLGRRRVIVLGLFVYALVYLGFALGTSVWQIWLLFAAYGLYYGITQGAASAFIADLVPAERRGTAYGLFQGITGLVLLPASIIAGWIWNAISPAATFYFGAALAFLAMLGIMFLVKERPKNPELGR